MRGGSHRRAAGTVLRAARSAWRLISDAPYREAAALALRQGGPAFQCDGATFVDRYPRIFAFVRSVLGAECEGRVLSFGCSTGEEVFSLREYLPRTWIKGVDVNRSAITACLERLAKSGDPRITFEHGHGVAGEPSGAYAAIFCMAVLKNSRLNAPGVTRCDPLMRFSDFAAMVEAFARCLQPGGLLIIRHTNFRLCDTPRAGDFTTLLQVPNLQHPTPFFGPDDRLLEGVAYADTVFRKRSPTA